MSDITIIESFGLLLFGFLIGILLITTLSLLGVGTYKNTQLAQWECSQTTQVLTSDNELDCINSGGLIGENQRCYKNFCTEQKYVFTEPVNFRLYGYFEIPLVVDVNKSE